MFSNPISRIKKNIGLLVVVGLVCALAVSFLTLLFPREYRADAQVLIISKARNGVDPYTVVKSAERIGENLVQIMQTDDFFRKVTTQASYNLNLSRFEGIAERQKRKRWAKTLQPSVVYGTGVLNISTYATSAGQAEQLAGASAQALVSSGWEYVGGDVAIKVVNDPVVTKWPARPNIFVNALVAFLLSILISATIVARRSS